MGGVPGLQINVDATAMIQAGLGSGYAQQIITAEIADFVSKSAGAAVSPVNLVVRIDVQSECNDRLVRQRDGYHQ